MSGNRGRSREKTGAKEDRRGCVTVTMGRLVKVNKGWKGRREQDT